MLRARVIANDLDYSRRHFNWSRSPRARLERNSCAACRLLSAISDFMIRGRKLWPTLSNGQETAMPFIVKWGESHKQRSVRYLRRRNHNEHP